MKKSIKAIVLATAASSLALPTIGQATDFRYDGIELSYVTGTSEETGPVGEFDIDAAVIELNYSITPSIVVGGAYLTANGKPDVAVQGGGTRSVKYSGTGPAIFAFYHAELNEKMAYQVGARYASIKTKLSASNFQGLDRFNGKDDSKSIIGGLRYEFNEQVELELMIDYDLDAEKGEDDFSYAVGARYQILPDLDAALAVEFADGGRNLKASIKKYFDFSR